MIDPPPLFRAQSTPTAQDRKNESSDLRISEHLEFKHLGSPENYVQTLGVPNCLHDLAAKRPGKFPFKHLGSPEISIQTLGVEENRITLNSESSKIFLPAAQKDHLTMDTHRAECGENFGFCRLIDGKIAP